MTTWPQTSIFIICLTLQMSWYFFLEASASSSVAPFSLFQAVSCLLIFMCSVSNHRLLGSQKSKKQEYFFQKVVKIFVLSFQGQV